MFWTRNKTSGQSPTRRRRTLGFELTIWYGVPMSVLVVGICAAMYLSLAHALQRECDSRLENEVSLLRHLVNSAANNSDTLRSLIIQETQESEGPDSHAARVQGGQLFVLRMLDQDGRVLVERSKLSALIPASAIPPVPPAEGPLDAAEWTLPDGRRFRVTALLAGSKETPVVLHIATDTRLEDVLLSKYRRGVVGTLAAGLSLCLALSYVMARLAIRPVRRMARSAESIGQNNLHERISLEDLPHELAQLATSFNAVLGHLDLSFTRLSQFTEDIAHELRTPVAVIRGEMEVALLRSRTEEEYRAVMASTLDEGRRMQQLIDRLLFLARADNNDAVINKEPLDLATELSTIGEYYALTSEEVGVSMRVTTDACPPVLLDKVLFQSAVGNLVENAIRYSPSGGQVTIAARGEGDHAVIEVTDGGPGISKEHLPFLFDRLYQVDAARTRKKTHVGLGLALVKAITELHRGRVELRSEVGLGTTATLQFPLQ